MVDVVQLVEHRIVVPSVVGSSPIIHPTENEEVLKKRGPLIFSWVDDIHSKYRGLCPLIPPRGLFPLYDFAWLQNPGIGLNQVKSGWARGGGKGFSGKSDGGMVKIAIFVDTTICALKYG